MKPLGKEEWGMVAHRYENNRNLTMDIFALKWDQVWSVIYIWIITIGKH